jgi:hypothetical protein
MSASEEGFAIFDRLDEAERKLAGTDRAWESASADLRVLNGQWADGEVVVSDGDLIAASARERAAWERRHYWDTEVKRLLGEIDRWWR